MREKSRLLEIIQQCKNDDSRSQFELYNITYNHAMGIVIRYVANKKDAEDVLSEAYYKLFKNIKKFDNNKNFYNWFNKILINASIDYIRKYKKLKISDSGIQNLNLFCSGNNSANLDYCRYLEAIQHLSPGYRMVFNLYVIDGYKHKEIAEKLGINEGTSKSNLVKAKRKLKEIFTNLKYLND